MLSFFDFCDCNGIFKEYLFFVCCLSDFDDGLVCFIDEVMMFFDIEVGRWYWIKFEYWCYYFFVFFYEFFEIRLLVMDESFVCEFIVLLDDLNKGYVIFIFDFIVKIVVVEFLFVLFYCYSCEISGLFIFMIIDVDKVVYIFKVFFNCDLRWYVYEFLIGVWCDLGMILDFQYVEVKKLFIFIIFYGIFYIIVWLFFVLKFVVFSYNFQIDEWRVLFGLRIFSYYYDLQFFVVGNWLFVVLCVSLNVLNLEFEVMEVLVGKNEVRVVVYIFNVCLLEYFDEGLLFCVFGFLVVDFQGVCKVIVLKFDLLGKLVMYEMVCGEVEVLLVYLMGLVFVFCCWKELGGLYYLIFWVFFICYGVGYGNLSMWNYLLLLVFVI